MSAHDRLRIAVFPGAANLPALHAQQTGRFAAVGLDVEIVDIRSAAEQIGGWDDGAFDLMQTSPDHLVRSRRRVAPRLVHVEGIGEVAVYAWPCSGERRFAVDEPDSGFALVLRAVMEDRAGERVERASLVPVGGTFQRFEALVARPRHVDGAALHLPFDALARAAGMEHIGGHVDVSPKLVCSCTVARRDRIDDAALRYAAAIDAATNELAAMPASALADRVATMGVAPGIAGAVAAELLGPAGLPASGAPSPEGLEAVIGLRRRFDPDFVPAEPIDELLGVVT